MIDVVKEAEYIIKQQFAMQAGIISNDRKYIEQLKKLPKANHIDSDYIALKP